MTRRHDIDTAEKVTLVLLTKAAFGLDAGVHVAMYYQLPISLVGEILAREKCQIRKEVQGVVAEVERRRQRRTTLQG